MARRLVMLSLPAVLAGCFSYSLPSRKEAPEEEAVIQGPVPRRNLTPIDPAFACLARGMRNAGRPVVALAVGDVKDYTGKYSTTEGSTVTQGGALMIYSALGKLGDVIQLQERFDTRIAELELAYTDKRQLGDGRQHAVEAGKPAVPWMPYFGGSILRSNYYIVGGITELNYNIYSGGGEATLSGVGAKRRTYTMNVGVDLRIVDSRSLVVMRTVSLQKQVTGEEVGAGVYRFFGSELVDINIGAKKQEPLQLGVRTAIEHGVVELVAAINNLDPRPCLDRVAMAQRASLKGEPLSATPLPEPQATPEAAPGMAARGANGAAAAQAPAAPLNVTGGNGATGGIPQIPFEFSSNAISPQGLTLIDKLAQAVSQGQAVSFQLVARDTELLPPLQRRELTNLRIRVITDALASRGIAAARIGTSWLPDPTDPGITRVGAGYQLIATLAIGR